MEFLEVIETIEAEHATVQRLFSGEGTGIRSGNGRTASPRYAEKLAEAARLIADVYTGRKPAYLLKEAMTTSDFPLLFGDVLDRQLLANYREFPAVYRNYVKIAQVRDFRSVSRYTMDGAESTLDEVPEQSEYPASSLSEARFQYAVKKHGRRIPFSWEAMINDDLDALKDVPERFGRAARRSEQRFATTLYVDANGPHASLYTAGNANIINTTNGASDDNPPLSISGLQDGLTVLANQVDSEGEPILIDVVHLVVPPALQVTAKNILNAVEVRINEAGGVSNQQLIVANWMRNGIQLSVDPYIPHVASNANGSTTWFLFADPSMGRPAVEMGFLRGHTEPEIFIKSPNAMRVGGGAVAPLDGDFDTDSIQYKVRHVFGGTRMSGISTVGSNGTSS